MKVLVTGGTGVLGRELVSRLRAQADVRVLSRHPPRGPGLVQGDLETGEGLSAPLDGVDAIAHCASAADCASHRHVRRGSMRGGPCSRPRAILRSQLPDEHSGRSESGGWCGRRQ
jgi:uncharacterized protein YbjT (DUF2867 family)